MTHPAPVSLSLSKTASLLAALALGGCTARAATLATAPPTPVTLATAVAPGSPAAYTGPGTVVPQHIYNVAFEIPGRIVAVRADVGDRIPAGAVLAELDGTDYAAQARGADAQALEAAAAAEKARNGAREQERAGADEAVAAAAAQRDRALAAQRLARANQTRFDQLFASGDVAAQQHDQMDATARDADAGVAAANAQLAQAVAQRALVREGSRGEDLTASAAGAAAARASADLAHATLAKTRIAAPADAYVEQRAIEPGSTAQPGVTAFVLVDARDPDVLVAVPETRLGAIEAGSPARVVLDGRTSLGRVIRVEPDADPATRTAQVRVRVAGLRARSGSVATVALGTARGSGDAAVPLAALVADSAGTTHVLVYDAARTTARPRAVHVVSGDGESAIVRGLAPGTRIVRAGAALVKPGAPLRVVSQ